MRFIPDKDIPAINVPDIAVVMRPILGRIIGLSTKRTHYSCTILDFFRLHSIYAQTVTPQNT